MRDLIRGIPIVLPLIVAAFMVAAARGQDDLDENERFLRGEVGERLIEHLSQAELRGFSGAILAARDGEVVIAAGAGFADLGGTIPITPAALFEIASATKPFTAAAVVRLADEGRLKLDDPIGVLLPEIPQDCAAITIEHLLRHTSGIPGTNSQGRGDEFTDVIATFFAGGPRHPPGTRWEYWNQGYAVVSEIIARVSGAPCTEFCRTALFMPAGMTSTCFTGDTPADGAIVTIGRSARGAPRSALEHPYGSYGFQYRGIGGIVTNVWDLWRWDRALRGDGIISEKAKSLMFTSGLGDYGLGWFVRANAAGRLVQSHGGAVRGFVCEIRRYPEEDGFLAVLCNTDDAPVKRIADQLESILFDDEEASDPARAQLQPLEAELRAALSGSYKDERGTVFLIESRGAATVVRIEWYGSSGQVTRAALLIDDAGRLILDDGSAALHEVGVNREENGGVQSLTLLSRTFIRANE